MSGVFNHSDGIIARRAKNLSDNYFPSYRQGEPSYWVIVMRLNDQYLVYGHAKNMLRRHKNLHRTVIHKHGTAHELQNPM
jgi:hypothetical protein